MSSEEKAASLEAAQPPAPASTDLPAPAPAPATEDRPLTTLQAVKRSLLQILRAQPRSLFIGGCVGLFIPLAEEVFQRDRGTIVIGMLWTYFSWTCSLEGLHTSESGLDPISDRIVRVLFTLAVWNVVNFVDGKCGDKMCLTRTPSPWATMDTFAYTMPDGSEYTCHHD